MADNIEQKTDAAKLNEKLWNVVEQAMKFVEKLERTKVDLGEAEQLKTDLKDSFKPLMEEPRLLKNRAEKAMENHEWEKALEAYEKMGDETPEIIRAKTDIYINLKKYAKASEYVDKLLEIDENNPRAWLNKASLNYLRGVHLEDSVFYLERALELDPDNIDAQVLMCKTWLERAEKKTDKFIKKRMLKESMDCLNRAGKLADSLDSPMKEFHLARIYALKSKADPDKEEEYLGKLAENLQNAVEQDQDGVMMIREMISEEKAFAGLGIEFVEVSDEGKASDAQPSGEKKDSGRKMPSPGDLAKQNRQMKKKADAVSKIGMLSPDDLYKS